MSGKHADVMSLTRYQARFQWVKNWSGLKTAPVTIPQFSGRHLFYICLYFGIFGIIYVLKCFY